MSSIPQALALAVQHHQAGQLQTAQQIYQQILSAEPNQPDALHLLGVIAIQMKMPDLAVQNIERAIRLRGNVAFYHNNLGEAYRNLDKKDQAIACYRRALDLKPDYAEAHNNLGNVFRDLGQLEEAIGRYRMAVKLKPDYAEAFGNLGTALKERGEWNEAIDCYRRALQLRPNYAEAYNNLGNILRDQGRLGEAVDNYHWALQVNPDYPEAHSNLGLALKEQERFEEAAASCRRALALRPDFAEVHSNLGLVLEAQGRSAEAVACHRRAVELKPDYAGAHYNLGAVLESLGDLEGAANAFRAALRCDDRCVLAHVKLADLLGKKLPPENRAALGRLLDDATLPDDQRLLLHFALAHDLDHRGQYAEAAAHLRAGNAMQLQQWQKRGRLYDPTEIGTLIDTMIGVCTPEFFSRTASFGLEDLGPQGESPVFVLGLPRSGTTLIEQILAAHSQVSSAGECKLAQRTMVALGGPEMTPSEGLRRLDHQTARRLALGYLEALHAWHPAALRIVDKMPDNYLFLGLLASLFPRARFIHCRRDLRDVAVSCWMTHFRDVRWANDPQHIACRFRDYRRLMEHWRRVLPGRILDVDYEETVTNLEGVARRLIDWCGLAWEPGCLEFQRAGGAVRTASSTQVRQPLYTTSVGRWRNYEEPLAELFTAINGV